MSHNQINKETSTSEYFTVCRMIEPNDGGTPFLWVDYREAYRTLHKFTAEKWANDRNEELENDDTQVIHYFRVCKVATVKTIEVC